MRRFQAFNVALWLLALCLGVHADTLTLHNGDHLTGTLEHADHTKLVFKSASAGEVTVNWSDVDRLVTTESYAVISQSGPIHQGTFTATAGTIDMEGVPIPISGVRIIVTTKDFNSSLRGQDLVQGWHGAVMAGFSQVSATQSSTSLTAGANLQRPVPAYDWAARQTSNTLVHFQAAYGRLSQPGEPVVKTSIFSFSLEQDENFNARLFALADAALDHNYSQGLQLQQAYGAGIGWNVRQTPKELFSVRADLHWTHQQFLSGPDVSFLASNFTETGMRKFGKLVWTENATAAPAYSKSNAFQASGSTALGLPVYRSLGANVSFADSYLGNPQPGFQRNSAQFSLGLQWTLP